MTMVLVSGYFTLVFSLWAGEYIRTTPQQNLRVDFGVFLFIGCVLSQGLFIYTLSNMVSAFVGGSICGF